MKFPYPQLLGTNYTSKGNDRAFREMPAVVQMFQGQSEPFTGNREDYTGKGELDLIFEHMISEDSQIDPFELYGEMTNQFIQAFPEMKDAWASLSPDQRWLFIQGLHYGIEPLVRDHMGFKQI